MKSRYILLLTAVCLALTACSSVESRELVSDAKVSTISLPATESATATTTAQTLPESATATTTAQTLPESISTTAGEIDVEPETSAATEPPETKTQTETATETEIQTAEPAGSASDSYQVIGENGILVIGRGGHYMGLMPCWGTYGYCDYYVSCVNKFAQKLPDVNVYSMVVPTSVEFYLPSNCTGFTASQKDKIDYIAENLSSSVTSIDAYSYLEKHTDENIYARTDHHWLPLGAYYAAKAFADKTELTFPSLSKYEKVSLGGYVGSMYNYSKDLNLYNDPEVFTMYISPNDSALKTTYYSTSFTKGYESDLFVSRQAYSFYCSFLGSDDRIAKIETDAGNGKTLVIFKESYGNALVPFLTSAFETIYVCDIRYFDLNAVSFCKDVGATDLLFATCTFTPAGGNCDYMGYILG